MIAIHRFLFSILVSLSGVIATPSIGSAQPVNLGDCQGMFSITATDLSGAAISGDFTSVEIRSDQGDWEQWYALDHTVTGTGKATVCHMTNSQLDQFNRDNEMTLDTTLRAGDAVFVTFVQTNSSIVQTYSFELSEADSSTVNSNQVLNLPNLVTSPSSQVPLVVKDSSGAIQSLADWQIFEEIAMSEDGETWSDYRYVASGAADSNGAIGVAGLQNGNFQLVVYPGLNSSPNSMKVKTSFQVDGGIATFENDIQSSGIISLPEGNTRFKLTAPDGTDLSDDVQNTLEVYSDDEDLPWDVFTRRPDGYFVASLPDKASGYVVSANPGPETGYVRTVFQVVVSGSDISISKNSQPVTENRIPLDAANLELKAVDVAGNPIPWASFYIFNDTTCTTEASITGLYNCDRNIQSVTSSRNGFAKVRVESGTYWLYMAFYEGIYGSAPSLSKLTFDTDSPSSSALTGFGELLPVEGGNLPAIRLSARPTNLNISVTDADSNAINGGWVNAEKVCSGMCDWNEFDNPYTTVDAAGKFSLYLKPSGNTSAVQYRVTVGPNDRTPNASESYFIATVNAQGVVSLVEPPDYRPGTVTGPSSGTWTVKLPKPNFGGVVRLPDSPEVAKYAQFQVKAWDSSSSQYNLQNNLPNIYADELGEFSGYFAPGQYEITVNPPYGLSNVAENRYELVVDSSNRVCLLENSTGGVCSSGITFGELTLFLSVPNVSGQVLKGNSPVGSGEFASVELRKWDKVSNYWQWLRWSDVDRSGRYSFNIQETGTYQIMATPSNVDGYSNGSEYIVVGQDANGLTFCKIPEPGLDTISRATCAGNTATAGPLSADVRLKAANLQLEISVPPTFAGGLYAQIYKIMELSGWESWNYHGFINLRSASEANKFAGFSALSDNNSNPAKYRIEIDAWTSGQNTLPLAKEAIYVWASNFDTSDAAIEICRDADYNPISETCATGKLLGSGAALPLELGYGNLSGQAITPTELPVSYASLNVEKWKQCIQCGGNYFWQWDNNNSNASSGGLFGLNISKPGYYRITTRQQWGGKLPFSDGITIVKVDANKDWCVIEGAVLNNGSTDQPSAATCTMGRDNNPTDSINGLTTSLANPKISGQLNLVSGSPARNAWVSLRKWNSTYGYYEHSGWATTNSEGKYFLNPEDGDLQLNFQPGWEDRLGQVIFDKQVCIGASVPAGNRPADAAATCSSSVSLTDSFPEPNIGGIVCKKADSGCTSNGARYSWIEVRAKGQSPSDNPDEWAWTSQGTSTDLQGRFALLLPAGSDISPKVYALRAQPNDSTSQGVATRIVISVGATQCKIAATVTPCKDLKINLRSPNLVGQLTFDRTEASDELERKLMKYSWLSIFGENYGSYVAGASTNSEGKFAANLDDGTYFIDAYSNSSVASRPSLRLTVNVSGGVTSWKYRNEVTYTTDPIVADFDYVLPNVKIKLSSEFTTSRIVLIKDQAATGTEQPRRFVASSSAPGQVLFAKGVLTKGRSYTFKVIPNYGETLTGVCVSAPVSITQDEGTNDPDIIDLTSCHAG